MKTVRNTHKKIKLRGSYMSPRFYSYLWIACAVIAGALWIAGYFSMLTLVVFGFVAFGLIFMGMMCVLPGTASHPPVAKVSANDLSEGEANRHLGVPIGLRPN
jgi:hypothetical protein